MKTRFTTVFLCCFITSIFAQIPNPSFENWETDNDHFQPVGWDLNSGPQKISGEQIPSDIDGNYALQFESHWWFEGFCTSTAYALYVPDTIYTYLNLYIKIDTLDPGIWGNPGLELGGVSVTLYEINAVTGSSDTIAYWDYFEITNGFIPVSIPVSQTGLTGQILSIQALGSCAFFATHYTQVTIDKVELSNEAILVDDNNTKFGKKEVPGISNSGGFIGNEIKNRESINSELNDRFNIYPNPASVELTFETKTSEKDNIRILITDFSGKVLQEFEKTGGFNRDIINLSDMSPGYYLVHLISGEERLSRKFVVVK